MKLKLYLLTLFTITGFAFGLMAQNTGTVTAKRPTFLTQLYYDSLKNTPAIYKGIGHTYYSFRIEGHPYFYSDDMIACKITYNGFVYDSIEAYYDLHKQTIIVQHDQSPYDIALEQKKVSQFSIHGHTFESLYVDTIPGMESGYYDRMVDGNVKFYVRREKELKKELESRTVRRWFQGLDKYYLLKEGMYYRVRGKANVLKVLVEHKKQLKSFIKTKRISFNTFPEDGMAKIVEYYNEL